MSERATLRSKGEMHPRTCYRFADLTLDIGRRRLERGGQPIELGKLTYALLVALVETAPDVLTHDDLVKRVWGGRATSSETVTQRVKLLRDALGDDADQPRYVGLVRGQGYRLVAEPTVIPLAGAPRPSAKPPRVTLALGLAAIAIVVLVAAVAMQLTRETPPRPVAGADADGRSLLPRSVAVLPFDNLSPDPANAHFAAGIHETLQSELTAVKGITVIARPSVARYADGRTPPAQIATELRVQTLLKGSVQYSDGRVRITATLIEPQTGTQLWARRYDRELDDIFAIQTDIATSIVAALEAELDPAERRALETPPTTSPAAYALYLETLRDVRRLRAPLEANRGRVSLLDRAIAIDPSFAEAYLAKAFIYVWAIAYSEFGSSAADIERRAEYERLALENAAQAAELHPTLPGPWVVRGVLHLEAWRWDEAGAAFTRALELGPKDPDVIHELVYFYLYSGEYAEALQFARRRLELDPNSGEAHNAVGFTAMIQGDATTARDRYLECTRLAPGRWYSYMFLASAQIGLGDAAAAEQSLRTAELLRGDEDTAIFMASVAHHYHRLGLDEDAKRAFAAFESWTRSHIPSAGDWAIAYQGLGDYDKVYEWLQRAVEQTEAHEPDSHQALIGFVANFARDPVLEEPRFRELRARLLPPKSRAAFEEPRSSAAK
jgi:TolB-like protein/DNA-binding winged helix-turn-helix (wHTH) protein/tetratricopeptide (TPR) repeat protein